MKINIPTENEMKLIIKWGVLYCALHIPKILLYSLDNLCEGISFACKKLDHVYSIAFILPMQSLVWSNQSQIQTNKQDSILSVKKDEDMIIKDVLSVIKGKHIILLGGTGTGKSTAAKYLISLIIANTQCNVRVYDPEGMFPIFPNWQLFGKAENWDEINKCMQEDIDKLSLHFKNELPEQKTPTDIYLCEEFPDIVYECENSNIWIDKHARRGRKAGKFMMLLSQYPEISAFGLEGKSGLLKSFVIIRLGEYAKQHARKLKIPNAINWLKESKSNCMIDDNLLQLPALEIMNTTINNFLNTIKLLPSSYQQHYNINTPQSPEVPTEIGKKQFLDLQNSTATDEFEAKFYTIYTLLQQDASNYQICNEVFGVKGGTRYQELCARLDSIRKSI